MLLSLCLSRCLQVRISEALLQINTQQLLQDIATAPLPHLLTWHMSDFISLPVPLHSFVLLAAGAKPCLGFRVWMHKGDLGASDGNDVDQVLEVTKMVAPLPPLKGVSMLRK